MKYSSQISSLPFDLFTPDLNKLPKDNRWVKLGDSLPWDKIELVYNSRLNRRNRRILRLLHIKAGGKPLGRPVKSDAAKEGYEALMARYYGERNEVEATFGTGKRVYRANNIRKRSKKRTTEKESSQRIKQGINFAKKQGTPCCILQKKKEGAGMHM